MNINEVSNEMENVNQKKFGMLKGLLQKNGSCSMDGYLGSEQINFSFDECGLLEFKTENNSNDFITESVGVVLDDNVVIKQIQISRDRVYNQLISWDVENNSYTYIAFDNKNSLEECFNKIKENNVNIAHEDISLKFNELGISFDDIAQVLLDQKVDILSSMVEESNANSYDNNSFAL